MQKKGLGGVTQLLKESKEKQYQKKIARSLSQYGIEQRDLGKGFSILCLVGVIGFGMNEHTIPLVLCGLGLTLFLGQWVSGAKKVAKGQRYTKYWQVLGGCQDFSIRKLAQLTNSDVNLVTKDLGEMVSLSFFEEGFVDVQNDKVVLASVSEYIRHLEQAPPLQEVVPSQEREILARIHQANKNIHNPVLSSQIEQIATITGRIVSYEVQNEGDKREIQQFLDYYLPTTLKLLHAYGELEGEPIVGENITKSMTQIEEIISKVVDAFQRQLDRLFRNETMDIATDIAVLEQMFQKDGLSGSVLPSIDSLSEKNP